MRSPHDSDDDPFDRDATPQAAADTLRRHRNASNVTRVHAAKEFLTDRERQVIELCIENGRTEVQVAELLGTTRRAVQWIKRTALRKLREMLT